MEAREYSVIGEIMPRLCSNASSNPKLCRSGPRCTSLVTQTNTNEIHRDKHSIVTEVITLMDIWKATI